MLYIYICMYAYILILILAHDLRFALVGSELQPSSTKQQKRFRWGFGFRGEARQPRTNPGSVAGLGLSKLSNLGPSWGTRFAVQSQVYWCLR